MNNQQNNSKHVTAVLNMPIKIGDQILRVKYVAQKLSNNPDFPDPFPSNICSLIQLNTDIAALDVAETAALNRTKGASAVRDAAMHTVLLDIKGLKAMVQAKADVDLVNAESIIKNAGFDVKAPTTHQKQGNKAVSDNVPGVVDVTAEGGGAHEWQMSVDQINISPLEPTTVSNITVTGLTSGDILYFRNRKIGRVGGMYAWSPWVQVRVK